MIETADRLFYVLTGVRQSSIPEDSPEYGVKVLSGDLEGITVITAIDRNGGTLPQDVWPNIVIEAVSEIEQNRLFKNVTLALSIGVSCSGRFTSFFRIGRLVRAVKIALASNYQLTIAGSTWAGSGQIQSVDYGIGTDDSGNKVGKRYGNIVVTYLVPTETNIQN